MRTLAILSQAIIVFILSSESSYAFTEMNLKFHKKSLMGENCSMTENLRILKDKVLVGARQINCYKANINNRNNIGQIYIIGKKYKKTASCNYNYKTGITICDDGYTERLISNEEFPVLSEKQSIENTYSATLRKNKLTLKRTRIRKDNFNQKTRIKYVIDIKSCEFIKYNETNSYWKAAGCRFPD